MGNRILKLTSAPSWVPAIITIVNTLILGVLAYGLYSSDQAEAGRRIEQLEKQSVIQCDKFDALAARFEQLRADIHKMRTTINRVDTRVLKAERAREK